MLVLLAGAPGRGAEQSSQEAVDPQPRGSFDLAAANRIVDHYFRHVLSTLPRDWRQAEEKKIRTKPPRLGPNGLFQINGPAGVLAFEHDAENGRLICWVVVHKVRGEYPPIGLTREEILTALQKGAARGISTGGGEMVYDPVSDGFFVRRDYLEPPKDMKRMVRELDRLTAAGEKWSRQHYLQAVLSHAETMRPPASATARNQGFRATLALTPDIRYRDLWDRPPGAVMPQLVTRPELEIGGTIFAPIFFSGATAGPNGRARVEAELSVDYPDGKPAAWGFDALLWNAVAPPAGHLQFGTTTRSFTFPAGEPLGRYRVRARVCDVASDRCVSLEHPLQLLPASRG